MPLWAYILAGAVTLIALATLAELVIRKPGKRPLAEMRPTDFDDQEDAQDALGLEATDLEVVNAAAKMNNMMGLDYGSGWPGFRTKKGRKAK